MPRTIEVQYRSILSRQWERANTSNMFSALSALKSELGSAEYRARWDESDAWHYIGRGPQNHTSDYCETPLAETYEDYINSKETLMPAPTPAMPLPPDCLVKINIARDAGKLQLIINAKPLHDLLDSVGAVHERNEYVDQPPTNFSGVSSSNKLSTKLFLRREYPVKFALGQHFSKPPSLRDLKTLCESGHEAVKTILQHYQPVDISYEISKLMD